MRPHLCRRKFLWGESARYPGGGTEEIPVTFLLNRTAPLSRVFYARD